MVETFPEPVLLLPVFMPFSFGNSLEQAQIKYVMCRLSQI